MRSACQSAGCCSKIDDAGGLPIARLAWRSHPTPQHRSSFASGRGSWYARRALLRPARPPRLAPVVARRVPAINTRGAGVVHLRRPLRGRGRVLGRRGRVGGPLRVDGGARRDVANLARRGARVRAARDGHDRLLRRLQRQRRARRAAAAGRRRVVAAVGGIVHHVRRERARRRRVLGPGRRRPGGGASEPHVARHCARQVPHLRHRRRRRPRVLGRDRQLRPRRRARRAAVGVGGSRREAHVRDRGGGRSRRRAARLLGRDAGARAGGSVVVAARRRGRGDGRAVGAGARRSRHPAARFSATHPPTSAPRRSRAPSTTAAR